jgi:prolipoprotein diacylglyceryltransferase
MLPVLPIGPLTLPTRPVLILLGVWIGLTLAEREGRRRRISARLTTDALGGLVIGYLTARLAALLPYGLSSPLDLIYFLRATDALLAPLPGLLTMSAWIIWRWRIHRIPWRAGLDALAPLLLTLAVAWGLGDWAEGLRYGKPTTLPLVAALGGERHPVPLYEAALGSLAWLLWGRLRRRSWAPGGVFLLALTLYSAVRWFTEGFGTGSPILQTVALAGMLLGLWGLSRLTQEGSATPPEDSSSRKKCFPHGPDCRWTRPSGPAGANGPTEPAAHQGLARVLAIEQPGQGPNAAMELPEPLDALDVRGQIAHEGHIEGDVVARLGPHPPRVKSEVPTGDAHRLQIPRDSHPRHVLQAVTTLPSRLPFGEQAPMASV